MNLCVIPARGGSKRIPRKNIKSFCGQPMIAYSIEAAVNSDCFDRIIVSTDDEEIAEIAKLYGADTPFVRPEHLSGDEASTTPVIKHAIAWFEGQGIVIDDICCLYATAPFVKAQVIADAYKMFQTSSADYCFSVTSFASPIQRALKLKPGGQVEMFQPENFNFRSQELEDAYHDAGQFYWGKSQAFKEDVLLFSESALAYILPRYLVQDIDTPEDWVKAELMFKALSLSDNAKLI